MVLRIYIVNIHWEYTLRIYIGNIHCEYTLRIYIVEWQLCGTQVTYIDSMEVKSYMWNIMLLFNWINLVRHASTQLVNPIQTLLE